MSMLLLAVLMGQNVPPEFRQSKTAAIDTALPSILVQVAKRAAEAELDPKRGVGNAMEIFRAEATNHPTDGALQMSINLRIAATALRGKFMAENGTMDKKTQKALSTFSKLDLREPGLPGWIQKTLEVNPAVKKKLEGKGGKVIKAAFLVRGSGIDSDKAYRAFAENFEKAGYSLMKVPAKEANFLLELAADEVRSASGAPTVRLALEIEKVAGGKTVWSQNLFRTTEAYALDPAMAMALEWVAAIGGREMFFQWLADQGLDGVLMRPPNPAEQHDHSQHAQTVTIPKAKLGSEPPPPSAPKPGVSMPVRP